VAAERSANPEETLDPAEWASLRELGHRMIDAMLDYRGTALDRLNQQIVMALQESGGAVPSGTIVGGRYILHAANANHRSRREDFDLFVREVIRVGKDLAGTTRAAPRPSET